MGLDDSLGPEKAKAGALLFRCVEKIIDTLNRRLDPGSFIREGDEDVPSPSFNSIDKLHFLLHGLIGIDDDIGKHVFHLRRIDPSLSDRRVFLDDLHPFGRGVSFQGEIQEMGNAVRLKMRSPGSIFFALKMYSFAKESCR